MCAPFSRTRLARFLTTHAPRLQKKRMPKADANEPWQHDMFNAERSLSDRLTNAPAGAPKMNFGIADRALKEALGDKGGLSIRGASTRGNVVQVAGLARGTTAADVEVRQFSFCVVHGTPT